MIISILTCRPNAEAAAASKPGEVLSDENPGQKSRARLASPQPRPTSPVDGAGGLTGCHDDARRQKSFLLMQNIFHTVS
jgi:hypothetical protein